MKFFAALASAKFAEQLLASAGFDFNALAAAGDVNALKTAIDAKVSAAKLDDAASATLKGEIVSLKSSLDAAKVQLSDISADYSAMAAGLTDAGVKVSAKADATEAETQAAVSAAIKSRAATLAQEQLAASGHAPIAGEPAGDPTSPGKNKKEMTRAAFFDLPLKAQRAFMKSGGRLTE